MSTALALASAPLVLSLMMIALVWRSPLPGRRYLALVFVETAIAYGTMSAESVGVLAPVAGALARAMNFFYGAPSLYLFAAEALSLPARRRWAHYLPFLANAAFCAVSFALRAEVGPYFIAVFIAETLQVGLYAVLLARAARGRERPREWRLAVGIALCYVAYYAASWAAAFLSESLPFLVAVPWVIGAGAMIAVAYRILRRPEYLSQAQHHGPPPAPPRYGGTRLEETEAEAIVAKARARLRASGDLSDAASGPRALAIAIGLPYYLLSRAVNERTGESVGELVNRERVGRAMAALRDSSGSVIDIGYDCGFSAKSSFNAVFKRMAGESPSDYRERSRGERRAQAGGTER